MLDKLLGLVLKMGYYCALGDGYVDPGTVPESFPEVSGGETEG
ncbi:MAG: hypothetical protein AB2L14_09810 [Candidatus Xenobiia bacterium LiM19]